VGQDGILRRVANPPAGRIDAAVGRLPIGRRMPSGPTRAPNHAYSIRLGSGLFPSGLPGVHFHVAPRFTRCTDQEQRRLAIEELKAGSLA
jgi:hypothetical protein